MFSFDGMRIFILFITIVLSISCAENTSKSYLKIQGEAQGTTYTVIYFDSLQRDFSVEIDSMLNTIDASVSTYVETSQISQFNALKDTSVWFDLDPIFYQNFILSKHIFNRTNGAFDPTVAPLYRFFKFDKGGLQIIDTIKRDSILQHRVGLNLIEVDYDNQRIRKRKGAVELNFNAIAQGFSVDFIGVNLEAMGINNYMVEIGGELLVKGKNPNGKLWRLAIEKPIEDATKNVELQKVINLSGKALATSGSYRKFYKIGEKRYAHVINPKTGMPVTHNMLSATVIANTCAEADAYATAFMVMGLEKSLAFVEEHKDELSAYFILGEKDELKEITSSNFEY